MARSAASLLTSPDDDFAEIIAWYEDLLSDAFPPADLTWEPVRIGPTWQWDGGWVLPQLTLGWRVLAWCGKWLRDKRGNPWQFTAEQTRFILWYFAVDDSGDFLYHSAVLQRLKGWGKDPVAACLAMAACFAEVTFDHWDGDVPVGREESNAWVQLVAVSLTQTQNTMKLFPSLVSPEARRHYGIQVGKENVYGLSDTRQIEAVTASPLALEGGRPTLIVRNETQNWVSGNGGHDMAGSIEGNAAKSEDGIARMLDICNAFRPGQDSVGQRTREGWESTQSTVNEDGDLVDSKALDFGLLYDSLEAPPEAPLTASAAPEVIKAIRGDATWLSVKRILASILNPNNPASESRRKWYNQITAAEDAWVTKQEWDVLARPSVEVLSDEPIALFFDGSKNDDATGLVGCRISDGHRVTFGMWQRPPGWNDKVQGRYQIPRDLVDAKVEWVFENHLVVGFFGDPSHTLDDETQESYWDNLFDVWHRRYRDRLKVWAKPGAGGHAVMWDMSSRVHSAEFTAAVGRTLQEITDREFTHDGDKRLALHVTNARRAPNAHGTSIRKRHREAKEKIDLAVCMVGSGLVRREYLNSRKPEKARTGSAAFFGGR